MPKKEENLEGFYPELVAVFSRGNREQMEQILKEMLQVLLEGQPGPEHAKMELIHMLSRISDYGIREIWRK